MINCYFTLKMFIIFFFLWISTILALPPKPGDLFELPIIHINDFHARFEETSLQSTACKPHMDNCIGGFSRLYTAVTSLKKEHPEALFLNAGDNFQGSMWYNVHKWNVTQYFMNMLPTDAYTLGNHEFDDGIAGVIPFMKYLNAPTVVANIDDSDEPDFQGSYQKSTIIHRGNKKIGVIGVMIRSTDELSATENLRFLDEAESVKTEAEKLKKVDQCDIIIVLSHCGIEVDRIIAKKGGPYINIIVGGHSHTLLYHGPNLPGPEKPVDDYPVEIVQASGNPVLIVQASCYTKYLGFITVYFDTQNKIHHWYGNPIYMNTNIAKDPKVDQLLLPWKEEVDKVGTKVIGESKVLLDQGDCSYNDCNIGNFITEAMVHSWINKSGAGEWTFAACAIMNNGGIRTGIDIGNITYSDLLTAQPFENFMDVVELRGDHLLQTLEHGFSETWGTKSDSAFSHMVQIAGIHLVVNRTLPAGTRIQSARIRCAKCEVPHYEPLDLKAHYKVVVNSFLIDGGDGFSMIPEHMTKHYHGRRDVDILMDYISRQSPVTQERDDRIRVVV